MASSKLESCFGLYVSTHSTARFWNVKTFCPPMNLTVITVCNGTLMYGISLAGLWRRNPKRHLKTAWCAMTTWSWARSSSGRRGERREHTLRYDSPLGYLNVSLFLLWSRNSLEYWDSNWSYVRSLKRPELSSFSSGHLRPLAAIIPAAVWWVLINSLHQIWKKKIENRYFHSITAHFVIK